MNIVLAHGILGFNTLLSINYFNGIKEHLESNPRIKVFVSQVDPVGSVADRGMQLAGQILNALGVTGSSPVLDPGEKTHIIAHSMGGLDSRFMLSPRNHANIADRISSLTAIGTPHNGSPIADLFFSVVDGNAPLEELSIVERKVHDMIESLGVSLEGLRDLTKDRAIAFNRDFEDNPGVRYFSVAGIGRKISFAGLSHLNLTPTCGFLLLSYEYLKNTIGDKAGEENDGVVTISSAQKYELITEPWPADHFEEVGHNIDRGPVGKPANFDYLTKYDEIADQLSRLTA